ncbi:MAG: hypothetical protein RLY16_1522 [Bacteroidota bacterium]|jgi:NAD(P)H-dependent FMN reductase
MYIIISGTNRVGSNTLKVARHYQQILTEKGVENQLISLEGMNLLERDAAFAQLEAEVLVPNHRFIFVIPEYNGSFPGALKLLFDTAKTHGIWFYKKAMLVGVATGRAGNLRGMDHLTAVLHHMKMTVYPIQLPLSKVDQLMSDAGVFHDAGTLQAIEQQINGFIDWADKN